MKNNRKDLTEEIQELANTGVEISTLLSLLADTTHTLSLQLSKQDQQIVDTLGNGLYGVMKLLENGLTKKLFDFEDNYVSIKGETYKGVDNVK